jgi:hypothetical protein
MPLLDLLLPRPEIWRDPFARELAFVMTGPVEVSTAGYPYLHSPAWRRLRDWVPLLLGDGSRALHAARLILDTCEAALRDGDPQAAPDDVERVRQAHKVVRQVVQTAAVTAPPQLWLLRYVLGALDDAGLSDRLLAGESIRADRCPPLLARELDVDLRFLLSRAYLVRSGKRLRMAPFAAARDVFTNVRSLGEARSFDGFSAWKAAVQGHAVGCDRALLTPPLPPETPREPGRWQANARDIELGFRLVPLVLALRATDRIPALVQAKVLDAATLCPADAELGAAAVEVFHACGVVDAAAGLTPLGQRVLERGPGPFGILHAYQPYMCELAGIWQNGRGAIGVRRGDNVAASQDANRRTFEKAHNALDRFCQDTGFTYQVFIEHAVGRGEATRQRWQRSGEAVRVYIGADLEDPAIDAALEQKKQGKLPANMQFIRNADIGRPDAIIDGLASLGASTEGAVMMVGNGFHEVRDQTDESMARVFAAYERAGIVLIFTEESALSVDALLETAWNTYHAGFRYVHERSGQGLRPAVPGPPSPLEDRLPASWTECAHRAGYVRATKYCSRTRTIYPYTPSTGHNPSISENHFFVPGRIAERLGL